MIYHHLMTKTTAAVVEEGIEKGGPTPLPAVHVRKKQADTLIFWE